MGRGEKHDQQASSAGLLFGPRRNKTISAETQRQLNKRKRQRSSQARKTSHIRILRSAEEELLKGQGQEMLAFLANPSPHGTIASERQELRALCERFRSHFRRRPTPEIFASPETVDALQQLRQRAELRQVPKKHQEALRSAMAMQASQLASEDVDERLQRASQEIGDLPRVWLTKGNSDSHLRAPNSEQLLCGKPYIHDSNHWNTRAATGTTTPLQEEITCQDCLKRHHQDKQPAESYSAEEWYERWKEQRDASVFSLEYEVSRAFGWRGPAATVTAEDIHNRLVDNQLATLRDSLDHSGYPIPSSLNPS